MLSLRRWGNTTIDEVKRIDTATLKRLEVDGLELNQSIFLACKSDFVCRSRYDDEIGAAEILHRLQCLRLLRG